MEELKYFEEQDSIDIKKYFYKILGIWYWFVITVFISLSIAYVLNRYSDKVYNVFATIIIAEDDDGSYYYDDEMIQGLNLFNQNKNIVNEIRIIQSYNMTKDAIKELDFGVSYYGVGRIRSPEVYTNCDFRIEMDSTHNQIYQHPISFQIINEDKVRVYSEGEFEFSQTLNYGETLENEFVKFKLIKRDTNFVSSDYNEYFIVINNIHLLAGGYNSKINIEQLDEEGSVLSISTQGFVAIKEINFINKLIDVYKNHDLEEKNIIAGNTIKFIDEQIANVLDSLRKAEDKLLAFRTDNKIINIEQEGLNVKRKIDNYQMEKASKIILKKYYNYLEDYISSAIESDVILAPPELGINDPLLRALIMKLSTLIEERKIIQYSATEENPSLTLVNIRINDTKKAIIENLKNLKKTNDIVIEELNKKIAEFNIEVEKLPSNENQLIDIKRVFDLNDNIYTYLLEKRAEAGITRASNISNIKVLDEASFRSATLVAPKTKMNYMISLFIGVLIPLIIIILKDYFNDKIVEKADIENKTKVPVLGVIGHNQKPVEVVVRENPKSSISESFRTIKTNLQYLLVDTDDNIITITSSVSGEGKTFCALNLASIIAMTHKKTLLIGLDLRKPKIHKEFNVNNDKGLSTYIIGQSKKEDIVIKTDIENLYITPSGPVPPNPAQLLESNKLEEFINYVKKEFDYIIIDTPPIALVSDALLFSKFSNSNIFVVRQDYTRKNVTELINELSKNKNIKNFNVLINDVQLPSYYGYGYGHGYGYGYGYGYRYGYGYGGDYYSDEKPDLNWIDKLLYTLRIKK